MAEATFSLDLHVLGPPLTFALSQDQTLRRKFRPRSTLRLSVCGRVRGTALTRNVEWFLFRTNTEPTILQNGLLSSFQRPIHRGVPRLGRVLPVWARRVRRGSVLIRGTGRSVNADRTFFRHPAVTFPSPRTCWALENLRGP